jgi:hypothetical protein
MDIAGVFDWFALESVRAAEQTNDMRQRELRPRNPADSVGHCGRGDRCVVGSGGLRLPCSIIAEHSVEGCGHFSHDGDDDDLGFFVGVGKAFVEGGRDCNGLR